jgi:type 1 fimbria pilin
MLGACLVAGGAQACSTIMWPVDRDLRYDTYPEAPKAWMWQVPGAITILDCVGPPFQTSVRLDMPDLLPVGDVTYNGIVMPAYEASPDSALLAVTQVQTFGWDQVALRNGEEVPYLADVSGEGRAAFAPQFYVFSRGGRMRTFETRGTLTMTSVERPAVNTVMPVRLRIEFPATTCPLQDVDETLQEVQIAELSTPGSTAREKVVAIRMNCGIDPPRARMTLVDAGDAGNTGSQLTPTADSDAQGVRVQLLRNGREMQFGQSWDFDPGTGGVHDHPFTARYIRLNEALKPGQIKGEAVLNVDYW